MSNENKKEFVSEFNAHETSQKLQDTELEEVSGGADVNPQITDAVT